MSTQSEIKPQSLPNLTTVPDLVDTIRIDSDNLRKESTSTKSSE
jgi:hypothetical protein